MWACLFGIAYKIVPGAKKAYLENRVPAAMFETHWQLTRGAAGEAPHPVQVWRSIMRSLTAEAP